MRRGRLGTRWGLAWRKPRDTSEDPENTDRKARAEWQMQAFDRLPVAVRDAVRVTRFDADPRPLETRLKMFGSEKPLIEEIRRTDRQHSGQFGPAFPSGI